MKVLNWTESNRVEQGQIECLDMSYVICHNIWHMTLLSRSFYEKRNSRLSVTRFDDLFILFSKLKVGFEINFAALLHAIYVIYDVICDMSYVMTYIWLKGMSIPGRIRIISSGSGLNDDDLFRLCDPDTKISGSGSGSFHQDQDWMIIICLDCIILIQKY